MFTNVIQMMNHVITSYQEDDLELTPTFFDFDVKMKKADILHAYKKIQNIINGDQVIRVDDHGEKIIFYKSGDDEIYEGNCRAFLEAYNMQPDYIRISANNDEVLSFI